MYVDVPNVYGLMKKKIPVDPFKTREHSECILPTKAVSILN